MSQRGRQGRRPDPGEAAKVAKGAGIPAGKWQAISDGWVAGMRTSMAVRTQFGTRYTKS